MNENIYFTIGIFVSCFTLISIWLNELKTSTFKKAVAEEVYACGVHWGATLAALILIVVILGLIILILIWPILFILIPAYFIAYLVKEPEDN